VVRSISEAEALSILERQESDFWDDKHRLAGGVKVQKIGCALANAEGGEFGVGIRDRKEATGLDRWEGFATQEDGNFIHQSLAQDCDPGVPYTIEWLQITEHPARGIVALVTVHKSVSVHRTAAGICWKRRGAQDHQLGDKQAVDLALSKGTRSYEDQMLEKYTADQLASEAELVAFLQGYSPPTAAADFVHKQRLSDAEGHASVAGAVLYAEEPPAVIPKKCAIKIARYETKSQKPERDHLKGTPVTIEGPARAAIEQALATVTQMIGEVSMMEPDGSLKPARYPPEALKEVIVNAVIHRDYNISEDIQVWVFENRIEVRSPGVLPGHMTIENLLTERFARNPLIVRLLNKYPDPPNKDIGEGLNTVFDKMKEARLQAPKIEDTGTSFVVTLGHTPLARPEELVMEYLESHDEIVNRIARELCGIGSENSMKDVFYRLQKAGKIEPVPGKRGSASAWRRTTGAAG
jgi:ATP-dependent DNA helicase RecG